MECFLSAESALVDELPTPTGVVARRQHVSQHGDPPGVHAQPWHAYTPSTIHVLARARRAFLCTIGKRLLTRIVAATSIRMIKEKEFHRYAGIIRQHRTKDPARIM